MAMSGSFGLPAGGDYDDKLPDSIEKHGYLDIESEHRYFSLKRYWVMLSRNSILYSTEPVPQLNHVVAHIKDFEMKPLVEPNDCSFLIKTTEWKAIFTAATKEQRDEWVSAIMLNFVNVWIREMTWRWFPWNPSENGEHVDQEHFMALQDIWRLASQIRRGGVITKHHVKQMANPDEETQRKVA